MKWTHFQNLAPVPAILEMAPFYKVFHTNIQPIGNLTFQPLPISFPVPFLVPMESTPTHYEFGGPFDFTSHLRVLIPETKLSALYYNISAKTPVQATSDLRTLHKTNELLEIKSGWNLFTPLYFLKCFYSTSQSMALSSR